MSPAFRKWGCSSYPGSADDLKRQLIDLTFERGLFAEHCRKHAGSFQSLLRREQSAAWLDCLEVCRMVGAVLTEWARVNKPRSSKARVAAMQDIEAQLKG